MTRLRNFIGQETAFVSSAMAYRDEDCKTAELLEMYTGDCMIEYQNGARCLVGSYKEAILILVEKGYKFR